MTRFLEPSVLVKPFDAKDTMSFLEYAARTCYKSEDKIGLGTADALIASILKRGHHSVIEHASVSVKFIVDRGVTHEIVRHRLAAYSQESTRYCNYSLGKFDGGVAFIIPFEMKENEEALQIWREAMIASEKSYLELAKKDVAPQWARSVLPNSLKTEIVTTFNLREWRHFFTLRAAAPAHPQMKQVVIPLLLYMQQQLPVIFGDITYDKEFPSVHYADVTPIT